MTHFIRLKIKKIANSFGLQHFATKIWFRYLGIKNRIHIDFLDKTILLKKKKREIIIPRGSNFFGSIGIVVRDFDDFFVTVIPTNGDDNVERIDFSTPKFHTLRKGNEKFYFHDICEPSTVTDIYVEKANLVAGSVVLDIGSYCGTQSVYFSRLVGENGLVLAFEPDKISYSSLVKNLETHQCRNVKALNYGVYSKDGTIGFSGDSGMGASVQESSEVKIEVKTLTTICTSFNLSKIDFIKMDIEGSEIDVLHSSTDVIQKFKPRFIIEPHFRDGILNDGEIVQIFKELNYKTVILKQGAFDYQPLIYAYPN